MTASDIGRACCLGALSARLPAGLLGDAVAIPTSLGDSVLHTLDALYPQLRPAVLHELPRARTYLFTEPGQGVSGVRTSGRSTPEPGSPPPTS